MIVTREKEIIGILYSVGGDYQLVLVLVLAM